MNAKDPAPDDLVEKVQEAIRKELDKKEGKS